MKFDVKEQVKNIFSGKLDFGFCEIARRCLGDRSRPMRPEQLNSNEMVSLDESRSPIEILRRALFDSEFNVALTESLESAFTEAYQQYQPSWAQAFNSVSVPRLPGKVLNITAVSDATAVSPGRPFPPAAVLGQDGDINLSKFGFLVRIPMETLVNNDVSTIQKIIAETVNSLRRAEDDSVFDVLQNTSGLFSSSNGNLLTSAALSSPTLDAARLKIRAMTAKGAKLRYRPKVLIVPAELEQTAIALLQADSIVKGTDKLELLVESRLTVADDWYLVADKKQCDSIVLQKLTGFETPQVQRIPNADANFDGVVYRAQPHTAAAAVNPFGVAKCEA